MLRGTWPDSKHAFNRVEEKLYILAAPEHGAFVILKHGVELADAFRIEGNEPAADAHHRLKCLAEHACADHLKSLFDGWGVFLLVLFHGLALKLGLDAFFHVAQFTGNALDAVVVSHAHEAFPCIGKMLVFKVCTKLALFHAHGDTADAVVFILLMTRPGSVDGDEAAQCADVNDAHGNVGAGVPVAVAVQNPLGGIPLCPRDDGVMMRRLVVLVLLVAVLHGLVVVEVGRPCLAGKDVAAVALIAHHRCDAGCRPFCVGCSVTPASAGFTLQLGQGFGDLLCAAAVEQHVVHEPDRLRLLLIDHQFLAVDSVFNHIDLVIAQQLRRHEAAPAEPPFEGEQHGLALHVRFLLGDHCQNEKNDIAGGIQRVEVFLLEQYRDRRVLLLQPAHPADAVDQVSRKAADGFGDDHVDLSRQCVLHHPLKAGTMQCLCPAESIVDIQAAELPFWVAADHFPVVFLLHLNGNGLLDVIRGNAAVCGNVENAFLLLPVCIGSDLVYARAVKGIELVTKGCLGALAFGLKARARRLPGLNRVVLLQGVALGFQLCSTLSGLLVGSRSGINHTIASPPGRGYGNVRQGVLCSFFLPPFCPQKRLHAGYVTLSHSYQTISTSVRMSLKNKDATPKASHPYHSVFCRTRRKGSRLST